MTLNAHPTEAALNGGGWASGQTSPTTSEQSSAAASEPAGARGSTKGFTGHLALFNQHLQQTRKSLEWRYESENGPGTNTTPRWVVRCYLDGDEIAEGRGNTKKAAQNDAAKEGLVKFGITSRRERSR